LPADEAATSAGTVNGQQPNWRSLTAAKRRQPDPSRPVLLSVGANDIYFSGWSPTDCRHPTSARCSAQRVTADGRDARGALSRDLPQGFASCARR